MPELGPLGTVRGALSNGRPYRERDTADSSSLANRWLRGSSMRIRSLIAAATLLAQFTSLPALAQDEAKPGVTDAQPTPNVRAPNAIPPSMLGFGDREKLCLAWSDGCVTCLRSESGGPVCSNIGISCQPKDIQCARQRHPETPK